jgi:hypothetical protein
MAKGNYGKVEHARWRVAPIGPHLKRGPHFLAHVWGTKGGFFAVIIGRDETKKFPTEPEARAWAETELAVVSE